MEPHRICNLTCALKAWRGQQMGGVTSKWL